MARYSGRYYKGASKDIKAEKRAEAAERYAKHLEREDRAKAVTYVPAGPDNSGW